MNCPSCNEQQARTFTEKFGIPYLECEACHFVYTDIETFDYETVNTTNNEDLLGTHTNKHTAPRFQKAYEEMLRSFEPYRELGTLLEIGCSTGAFIAKANKMGWQATGVEPVEVSAQTGIDEYGLDIRIGTLEDAALPSDSFDVAYSNAVLEHLPNPLEVLQEALRLLRPGGVLFADTVNVASYTWQNLGNDWKLVDPRMHLCLFTPETLKEICERAGFRCLQLSSHGVRFRPNKAGKPTGLTWLVDELRKAPYSFAARRNLKGDSIAILAQKPLSSM